MQNLPPDWSLPPGVSRDLWQHLHDAEQARTYDARLAETPLLQVDRLFVDRHCPIPGRLLDLGCGTGRLLVPLAQRGYRVVGVDLSEPMLRAARAKALAAGVPIGLVKANVVELAGLADASFDYAACLFSTLGMVSGVEQRRRVLAQVHRLLRPGGVFVLHVHNYGFNVWDRNGRRWLLRDRVRRWLGQPDAGDRPMPTAGFALHHFSRREVCRLLAATGFQLRELRPLGLGADGRLPWPGWFPGWRAYGYLLAAVRR